MRIIRVTDLAGRQQWVVNTWVQSVRQPLLHEHPTQARAVLIMSGYNLAVQEDPATVKDWLTE